MADEVKTMSANIVDGYTREAIQKGLELKAQREQEDALIALAEEYLASLEPPPPEADPAATAKKESEKQPEVKQPVKQPELHKK
jgi:hypothetical protein